MDFYGLVAAEPLFICQIPDIPIGVAASSRVQRTVTESEAFLGANYVASGREEGRDCDIEDYMPCYMPS